MISKLVFDLDGTLWKTEESYLYAYHTLQKKFHLHPLTEEQILAVVGLKLSDVKKIIFAAYPNADELTRLALEYSIEYVKTHPSFCSNIIEHLFEELYKRFDIYIISGCPRSYLETFLELSHTNQFITKAFSIEDGTKEDILCALSSQDKVLYVGDSYTDYEAILDHTRVFFCYAQYGYFKADCYDASIATLEEISSIMDELTQKEEMIGSYPYEVISYKGSNLTLIYKEKEVSYFGFLTIGQIDNFKVVLEKLKEKCTTVYGPFNGNTWYSYRLSLDSFDFSLYPDCMGNQELVDTFIALGFEVYRTYSSTLAPIHSSIWNRCKKAKVPTNITAAVYHNEDGYQHLEELYSIASIAFQKADFYEPISFTNFKNIYLKNIQLAHPDILLIYDNGKPIAFNFCYADLEKRFYVCKTTAILPEYQNKKILKILIDKSYQMMVEQGYEQVLYHFQNDRTKVLSGIFKNGIIRQKKYGVFRYENK